MQTRSLSLKISQWLVIVTAVLTGGCKEDEALSLFIRDMSDFVELEVPMASALQDPCLLENGHAAAKWYQNLPARHREALKQNVQRYVHAVKFVKTEIVSGVPVTQARTQIYYDHGTIIVATTGVLADGRVKCDPDIDILKDFTMAQSYATADTPTYR